MNFEPSRVLERFQRATQRLCQQIDPAGPGFSASLVVDGQALCSVHHGLAHLEWQQPIDGRTRFYLASESKPWVAALVLEAVAEGRLDLRADLRHQLAPLQDYTQAIQAGHLLRHTSGVSDYLGLWGTQLTQRDEDVVTREQALALIRRAEGPVFNPGSRYHYSNSNYLLLAECLLQASGESLATLARQRFFAPWGMHDSSFEDQPWRVLPRRARSYGHPEGDVATWRDLPVALATWGDGGLWSTPEDLARAEAGWLADWRARGASSLLARMASDDLRFAPPGQAYRMGLEWREHAGQGFAFHGGALAGFTSMLLRCPDQGQSLVLLSNLEGFDATEETWLEALWGEAALA